jgi:hypothetical protein
MDIYYFYNGFNNILKLALKDKKYLANSKIILNDPLVILDFEDYSNLKGGNPLLLVSKAKVLASKAKGAIGKAKGAIGSAASSAKGAAPESTTDQEPVSAAESNGNSSKEPSNKEEKELSPKEQVLKILKVLFSIVYYLCLFSILPLLPFIAISYYSFKRLKIFYNEEMGTL